MAYNYIPQFNPFGNFQPPIIPQQPQQQNGFMRVQSEEQARQYPVAVGNSMTFIDENRPYCYTKSMGFSQLDPPIFERYRLVKEDSAQTSIQESSPNANSIDLTQYALKSEIEECKKMYEELRTRMDEMKGGVLGE